MSESAGFYGREKELKELWSLWEQATLTDKKGNYIGSPQMKIILGETGLGKSRLVQAFYEQLSSHPAWDPDTHNYWPEFFNEIDNQLYVNPISKNLNADHEPDGAPMFLWLGSRWQPIDERNVEERICIIPHLREILDAHVRIAVRNSPKWLKFKRLSRKFIKSYEINDYADIGEIFLDYGDILSEFIPYANLVKKSYETYETIVNESKSQSSVSAQQEKVHQNASDKLLEELNYVFGGFSSGGLVLPTVLWLDDAQWIDGISQKFVNQLWEVANKKNWPLLILITHWEREWNQLKSIERESMGQSLLAYKDYATVLEPAKDTHLIEYLREKLPGLEPAQEALLIEKANGNFLSLVENVGYLMGYQELFIDQDLKKSLTNYASDIIEEWESDRHRRIEQRFHVLQPSHKMLLGWSSEVGEQFLKEILLQIAEETLSDQKGKAVENLEQCVDPYAILGRLNPHLYNFRDRAYFRQARKYFDGILKPKLTTQQQDSIDECWKEVLVEWINNSFDEQGNLVDNEEQSSSLKKIVTSLEIPERQVILKAGLKKLPFPVTPNWNRPADIASLRLRYLLIEIANEVGLYKEVKNLSGRFGSIEWGKTINKVFSITLLNNLCHILFKAAEYDHGEKIARASINMKEDASGPMQPATIMSLNHLAGVLQAKGDYNEAESLFRRSLAIHEEALGPKHIITATMMGNLAGVLQDKGDHNQAEPLYRQCLAIQEEVLGPMHPNTAKWLNAIASLVQAKGNYNEAERLYRRCLEIYEEAFGAKHPETATSMGNLAGVLQDKGNYNEAESLFRQCLAIHMDTLGPTHPTTATSMGNLAGVLQAKGNYNEAESLYRQNVAIHEKELGPKHPINANSLNNLALLFKAKGDFKEAELFFRRSLAIYEETLGPQKLDTATLLVNLASLLKAMGEYEETESLYRRILSIYEKTLGPKHLKTATPLNDLAYLLKTKGEYKEAESLYRRCLTIHEETSGAKHPNTATMMGNLAGVHQAKGDYEKAESLYRQCLAIHEEELGPTHSITATSLNNLALLLVDKGEFKEAESLFRRSIAIYNETLEPKQLDLAIFLGNLANLLKTKGEYMEAESLFRRSLAIRKETLGRKHPKTATSMGNLAGVLLDKGDYNEAEPLYRQCLAIHEETLGSKHPTTATSLNNLALLLRAKGDIK